MGASGVECVHLLLSITVLAITVLAITVLAITVLAITVLAITVLAITILVITVLAITVLAITVLAITVLAITILAITVLAITVLVITAAHPVLANGLDVAGEGDIPLHGHGHVGQAVGEEGQLLAELAEGALVVLGRSAGAGQGAAGQN